MVDVRLGADEAIPLAEVGEVELYHPKSWVTKYVFSQDAKVIAIQYSMTATAIGLVALVLSWLMRLQLGFPDTFSFIDPSDYLQFITMHGMIMVIYLLTAMFLGGFGNYLIPLMVGARDMVFPYVNMLSYWVYLLAVLVLVASFFVPGGPTGAGWTLYPPRVELCGDGIAGAHTGDDADAPALDDMGYFHGHRLSAAGFPRPVRRRRHDAI
jgi:cytochrome c oxidase subunit 1